MAHKVNLDALIPREDFDVSDTTIPAVQPSTIQIRNLERADFFYSVIRKPDFQRETSDWSPEKICDFIQSFIDGDLIPALILWQSGSQIFVIDGAHRLSALVAWVHNDYGDKETSRSFFDGIIPDDQTAAAAYTRKLIDRKVGSYADHQFAIQNPEKMKIEIVAQAKRLASQSVQLQWVKGDATKAEASFFKINQQASPIDKTELRLLKARKLPNALAARAIVRSGTGHKYWSSFSAPVRSEVEEIAKYINDLLFAPALKTPIKTLDLPVAGRGYSSQTLPLVFEFVNLANEVRSDVSLQADGSGEETLKFLRKCRVIVNRISGNHASSLGLHPAVYFYSSTGRYQPTAFMAVIAMLIHFDKTSKFGDFTRSRQAFETFIVKHRKFVNQVTLKYGSGAKGYARLKDLFLWLLDRLSENQSEATILSEMSKHPEFSFLQPTEQDDLTRHADFGTDAKSSVFLRDALKDPLRCAICGGLIHRNSISVDHIVRRAEGGKGEIENGQLTHPYCNTTVKN
ncbi:HNH endonuclease [Caballeronia arationis]|uniref:HNH endonuclease family protein n=1 Tax=Caballeronia arationis TaxID=1777142 RepID=UPI00074B5657|nr:DUF262 domain-containing protein [Caballeronia arationis]SAL00168.1 HNH endonuclease [Caballeronia arationis]